MKRMQIGRTSLLLAALAVASFAHAAQPAGAPPGMGPPPGMGGAPRGGGPGGFGGAPTEALPAAEVPAAVAMARPTEQEVAQVRATL